LSVVAVIAAAGCQGKAPLAPSGSNGPSESGENGGTTASTPPTGGHPIAARIAALEAATCACTTMSCALAVDGERLAWVSDHLEEILRYLEGPGRPAELEAGGKRVLACHQRIRDAATPEERAAFDAEMSRHLAALTALADEMCACTDGRCADAASVKFGALKDPAGPATQEQLDTANAMRLRMDGCRQRVLAGAGPRP
jgi:hypothetical protein